MGRQGTNHFTLRFLTGSLGKGQEQGRPTRVQGQNWSAQHYQEA